MAYLNAGNVVLGDWMQSIKGHPKTVATVSEAHTDDAAQLDDWIAKPIGGPLKFVFDWSVAFIALVFLMPLLLAIALLIKIQCGGSVIYKHKRVGFGGRSFNCLKFRSMVENGDKVLSEYLANNPDAQQEWKTFRKLKNDPRITPIGKFLRKSSLDELPQLLNVIKGEMSLVGPRPIVREEFLARDIDRVQYMRVRPGITGLWQISGRSNLNTERRIELDNSYVLNRSFATDFGIILKTIPSLLMRQGAM